MSTPAALPKIVWLRKHWNLKENPFPAAGIARLGGEDPRENGRLFNVNIQPEKITEAQEKFVLGAAYSGVKFAYLWSLGTGIKADARGFGKSVLMQYLVESVNEDFGKGILLSCGLDESDANEKPICAVMSSFDMANAKSLNAVFYEAARYACRFRVALDTPTLAERIRDRLVKNLGSDKTADLIAAIEGVQANLRGRTLGPPVEEFLKLLCGKDVKQLQQHVDAVTPAKRTRSGATYLATFLLMVKAAGIQHVLLCCDQLEDFASSSTSRQKRSTETERFRDYILELQPMSDMLSCVVTLHPRAVIAIGEMWHLADLPSYEHDREENRHRVVILDRIKSAKRAAELVATYLEPYRLKPAPEGQPLFPFTREAIEAIFSRADGKPRAILRSANALVETGSQENWPQIDGEQASRVLDSFALDDDEAAEPWGAPSRPAGSDIWSE